MLKGEKRLTGLKVKKGLLSDYDEGHLGSKDVPVLRILLAYLSSLSGGFL